MRPTITAFATSPDHGTGQARDMRVRWALEEVGQPYDVRLVSFREMKQPAHLARQPFGQIPTYEDGNLTLFESGAILLHIAERHPGLLPAEEPARARAINWIFAALSTLEPPIIEREQADFQAGKPWHGPEHLAFLDDNIRTRFRQLSGRLGQAVWLDGPFSAGDLMMVMVLRRMEGSALLAEFPNLLAYVARGEARPAFQRAYAAQRAVFTDAQHQHKPAHSRSAVSLR